MYTFIHKHTYTHLYTHIHICMINTHTCTYLYRPKNYSLQSRLNLWRVVVALKKNKKRGIHWTATTCEVFCCVFISHDSNPSSSFMCQQTDLFHKTKKRSRCLQSHLVAPFGNRTGLKAWKDNKAVQMVLRYVTYSPSPLYSSLLYQ